MKGKRMRKVLFSCVIIGVINVILSILNIRVILFSPKGIINEIISLILPFQGARASLVAVYQIFPELLPIVKNIISPFMGYAISLTLFISGLGVILRKSWGRTLSVIYGMGMIIISVIGMAIVIPNYFIVYYGEIEKQGSLAQGLAWGGALLYILTLIGTLLYPMILLIFFSRPKIKELFKK